MTVQEMSARCDCGRLASNQALYRKDDGTHFLGSAVCDVHRYALGRLRYAKRAEIIDHLAVG
jgi:hypothetical protein